MGTRPIYVRSFGAGAANCIAELRATKKSEQENLGVGEERNVTHAWGSQRSEVGAAKCPRRESGVMSGAPRVAAHELPAAAERGPSGVPKTR